MKGKNFSNAQIAQLLREIEAAYQVKNEDRFKIAAYEHAAASIEHATSEIKDLWDDGKLDDIPAIGKGIASHLDELFRTGKVKHFQEVMKGLPPAMFLFLEIPGIGPKTAYTLAKNLKIISKDKALEKLKKAAKEGKIRKFADFGEKSEQDILFGIESYKKGEMKTKRMLLPYADDLSKEMIDYLKQSPNVLEADPLGSLRRKVSTIGDIDISVSTNRPEKVMGHFLEFPRIKEVLGAGEKSLGRIVLQGGQQIDLRISQPKNYGAMLQYFTGSKQHNINLREFALKKGMSLSEYGIKRIMNHESRIKNQEKRIKSFKDEVCFYRDLGLEWIPPELREGNDEITVAKNHQLPKLVELKDIKGDLHLHSDFNIEPSHDLGVSSVEEMVNYAQDVGYEYVGFSEHNPSTSNHTKGQINSIIKRKKTFIEQIMSKKKNRVHILNGLEIDIKPDGSLAIDGKDFELLDYAIVSIHSVFDMPREKMTERIIKGLSHPKATIFAHPTGRLLEEREGYEINWDKLFDFCLQNKKILEISAYPNRLDLPDVLVKEAVKRGIKLIINTDSHSIDQMDLMKYGVSVARRGWAEKKDIVNTYSFEEIKKVLM